MGASGEFIHILSIDLVFPGSLYSLTFILESMSYEGDPHGFAVEG